MRPIAFGQIAATLASRGSHRLVGNSTLATAAGVLTLVLLIRWIANLGITLAVQSTGASVAVGQTQGAALVLMSGYLCLVAAPSAARLYLMLPRVTFVALAPGRWRLAAPPGANGTGPACPSGGLRGRASLPLIPAGPRSFCGNGAGRGW